MVRKLSKSAWLEVSPELAFRVVADVEKYPEFVPGCKSVKVKKVTERGLVAKVTVSGGGMKESFVTKNTHGAGAIHMAFVEGPFKTLEGSWSFTSIGEIGCRIQVELVFEAKGMLAPLLSGLADAVANQLVDAFARRIQKIADGHPV